MTERRCLPNHRESVSIGFEYEGFRYRATAGGDAMMDASVKADICQLTISAAVAIADAPFAELERQSRDLACLAACGFLAKQEAVDAAHNAAVAALGPGMVNRYGADSIQEIIVTGFRLEEQEREAAKPRVYRTPEATVSAFWYVVGLNDPAHLKRWLAEHPQDSRYLQKLWEAKCHPSK